MNRLIGTKECPIEDLELVGDDLMKWRFKIRSFDDSSQGDWSPHQPCLTLSAGACLAICLRLNID